MSDGLARYARTLAGLERKGRRRALLTEGGRDFTSNDFLGLASSPRLNAAVMEALARNVPVGSGGSRLLRGNHPEHEALEEEAAAFFGTGRCLYFGNGFTANLALFSTLPLREDRIFHDELVHASALDGIAMSKAASQSFRHGDVTALDDAIVTWRRQGGKGHAWIAVESLYSMDGDFAPLADLVEVADRHDAFLIIDEAHSTGVHGAGGRGVAAPFEGRENIVTLHTCGKGLGSSGALVAGHPVLCDYLVNRARPFIYSTAPSPLTAATVRESLRILRDEPERRILRVRGTGGRHAGACEAGTEGRSQARRFERRRRLVRGEHERTRSACSGRGAEARRESHGSKEVGRSASGRKVGS